MTGVPHISADSCSDERNGDDMLSSQVSSIEDLGDLSSYLDIIENKNLHVDPVENQHPPSNYTGNENMENDYDQESVCDESEYPENQGSVPRLDILMNQDKDVPESSPLSFYTEQRQHSTFDGHDNLQKDYIDMDTYNMIIKKEPEYTNLQPSGLLMNNLHMTNYEMLSPATVKSERCTPSPSSCSIFPQVTTTDTGAKRGRRRKKFSDEEKRQRRKQQNREAAERCRMKRKDHQHKIKQEYDQLKKSHDLLESQLRAKEEKYNKLETAFRQHLTQCRANIPYS